jgi:phosphoribosylcarboxyaminoimidazole (NCAIR) mutase
MGFGAFHFTNALWCTSGYCSVETAQKMQGILAAQILALYDPSIAGKLEAYKEYQDDIVMESVKKCKAPGIYK